MSSYNLRFSDPTKTEQVIVPAMPPGINIVDTSLSLTGRGYPNYGEKIAENFLHLLENFASPEPPENPIEGQLWYDTSDPENKVLRIMDGTASSTRWPSANGIYQQSNDPRLSSSASVKNGDIWVDTFSNQLKIYSGVSWTVVGPTAGGNKTGAIAEKIVDTANVERWVIKNYVDNNVVSILFDGETTSTFVPKQVISGFVSIKPGVNLSSRFGNKLIGTADSSLALEISGTKYNAESFLRKDDNSFGNQTITGRVLWRTPTNPTGAEGRDGIVINNELTSNYVQFYKNTNDAVIANNTPGGKILIRTRPSDSGSLFKTVEIENRSVSINTSTSVGLFALSVSGEVKFYNTLTVAQTNIEGTLSVTDNVTLGSNLKVIGLSTLTGKVSLGTISGSGVILHPNKNDAYDIGSLSNQFRHIYANSIGSTGTNIYGILRGEAYFPVGMITSYAGTIAPAGWLLCNGASVSTSTYENLYSVIGTTYGSGAGTFNVPNLTTATILTKNTVCAAVLTTSSTATSTILQLNTASIQVGHIVEGSGAIQFGTVVNQINTSSVTLSKPILVGLTTGTVVSFATATYINYIIKK